MTFPAFFNKGKKDTMQYKSNLLIAGLLILCVQGIAGERGALLSRTEARSLQSALSKYPLFAQSYDRAVRKIEQSIQSALEVPPPGEAGGYEHEKHKQNAREMQISGSLYLITGDERYARFVRDLLIRYAEMYPKLGKHPMSHDQAPGKLFHQMLNETVWLVNASLAYDCVFDYLKPLERNLIEQNLLMPMVTWFTKDQAKEMNRIHNHGTWTVAAVGITGYVLNNKDLVEQALYGTQKNGAGGFIKQLDLLFSPDGYYMEGPYYVRYAIQPFFLFAEVIERYEPERKIFAYREGILKKAYYAMLMTTFPNGVFPPINDASRTMNITDDGVMLATDIAYTRCGADRRLLQIARQQDEVALTLAGLTVARDLTSLTKADDLDWGSVEFTDGADGKQGGLGILRVGQGADQTMLLMKYGVHGEGHGHFDKLHFVFYDQRHEVIPDYGFARWINIEPKFGGRYLPENKSYAMQTIAHNTVTVDQQCQNGGNRQQADKMSGQRHFFDATNSQVQVMSGRADDYFPGVKMQRTMFLVRNSPLEFPVVLDLFRLVSPSEHVYDYPLHFRGQLINTNVTYDAQQQSMTTMGESAGYQHLWKQAVGQTDASPLVTWLDGNRYYSLLLSAKPGTEVFWGLSGANDPHFNLNVEPFVMCRQKGRDHLFAAVIEPHGYFNEAREVSRQARGIFQQVRVIGHDEIGSVVEYFGQNGLKWRLMVNNGPADREPKLHTVTFSGKQYSWKGNYQLDFNAD